MSALLSRLVDSLRHELQQLGETLALLEAQDDLAVPRWPEFIEPCITAVELRRGRVETARARRRLLEEHLARALHPAPGRALHRTAAPRPRRVPAYDRRPLRGGHPLFPARPRTRRTNHHLLRGRTDGLQRFIASLSPWMARPSLDAELQTKTPPPHTPAAPSSATVA